MQARPFLSLAGLGWFGDLRGGVAQRSNRLGRRFEYVEQCSMALCAPFFAVLGSKRKTQKCELLSIDTLGLAAGVDGAARIGGRHGLASCPKVQSTP